MKNYYFWNIFVNILKNDMFILLSPKLNLYDSQFFAFLRPDSACNKSFFILK